MIEFKEPPAKPTRSLSTKWVSVVERLTENRGEWALVGNYTPAVAHYIRRGAYGAFIPEELRSSTDEAKKIYMKQHWEVTARSTDGNHSDIYIRWLG